MLVLNSVTPYVQPISRIFFSGKTGTLYPLNNSSPVLVWPMPLATTTLPVGVNLAALGSS